MNAFHVCGILFAAWALTVSFLGIKHEKFPASKGAALVVGAISVILALAAVGTAVYTGKVTTYNMEITSPNSGQRQGWGRNSLLPGEKVVFEGYGGKVVEVLDNYREHIMDGVVFDDPDGVRRFVDAPEVARTAERGVTLNIGAAEALQLAPPDTAPGAAAGKVKRLFGGLRRR